MEYRAKCQRLTEEIREANFKLLSLGAVSFSFSSDYFFKMFPSAENIYLHQEHEKMIDMLKQEYDQKIHDLEKQVR